MYETILQRECEHGVSPLTNAHKTAYVDYTFANKDDIELGEHEIDFDQKSTEKIDTVEPTTTENSTLTKLPPKPTIPQYNAVAQETHCIWPTSMPFSMI